jgi:hypothetical protein
MRRTDLKIGEEYEQKGWGRSFRVRILATDPVPLPGWRGENGENGVAAERWDGQLYSTAGHWELVTVRPRDLVGPWADAVTRLEQQQERARQRAGAEAAVERDAATAGLDPTDYSLRWGFKPDGPQLRIDITAAAFHKLAAKVGAYDVVVGARQVVQE